MPELLKLVSPFFLTAVFCMALDLTPIYAILTAVVTIEPTAKASLIKGYRRLPA
ncbi:aromatic acid exporter family protein, partial [Staphylococcus argenteus]|nr:aromatic acid exporter family protein [Staphylococcus argenteus]